MKKAFSLVFIVFAIAMTDAFTQKKYGSKT